LAGTTPRDEFKRVHTPVSDFHFVDIWKEVYEAGLTTIYSVGLYPIRVWRIAAHL
jgi:hypothetical protein